MDLTARARRRSALRGLAATLLIAALACGCGQSSRQANEAGAGVEHVLEVWTPETGSRLELVQQRAAQFSAVHPDVKINMTVRDFGMGMAPEVLATSRGLGLSSMRERVRAVDGHLVIETAVAAGTELTVHIPLGAPPREP